MDNETMNKKINSERVPVFAYIIFVAIIVYVFSQGEISESVPRINVIICYCFLVFFLVVTGLSVTCRYDFQDDGLTAIWYGIFRHKFLWTSIPYAGVYLSNLKNPQIICTRHRWIKNQITPLYYFLFPFSTFRFPYSPSIYDELKKVCPGLDYVANRERVTEIYTQRNKK